MLRQKVAKLPNVSFDTSPAALSESVRQLKNIPVRLLVSPPPPFFFTVIVAVYVGDLG